MRVAVFGATGTIGTALLPVLARSHEVVALSRREHESNGVTWLTADAGDADSVRLALDGIDVAYYLVHSLGARDFEERDREAARTVAEQAQRAGVKQLVYLGGLGDDSPELSPHLRSRLDTERELGSGGVPLTTLRAAIIIGRGSAGFETIVALVDRLPAMVCPRWVGVRTQPISIADVVEYLAGVCGNPQAVGESFDVGGPEVMTYREMIERVGALRGKRPLIVEVPILTPRLSSYWLHLVTPVKASVARPLIEGLRNETVAKDERIRELLPIPLTPFDEAARAAVRH
ncbi:MAG: NAD(P)H-binding protein [Actinomycetota bacterium]